MPFHFNISVSKKYLALEIVSDWGSNEAFSKEQEFLKTGIFNIRRLIYTNFCQKLC